MSDHPLVAATDSAVSLSRAGFEPVDSAERMTVFDVLRGFALLAIVLANVHAFAGLMFAEALGVPPAYAAGMALLMRRARPARLLRVLAPVGRLALTNYLLQSLACPAPTGAVQPSRLGNPETQREPGKR